MRDTWKPVADWSFTAPVPVPPYVKDLMGTLFPSVHIVYNRSCRLYGMVDYGFDGKYTLIAWIAGTPNLNNTVNYLCRNHVRRIQQRGTKDEFLDKLRAKEREQQADMKRQAKDRIHEGSQRLAAVLATDTVVAMKPPKGNGNVSHSAEAGHEDPSADR